MQAILDAKPTNWPSIKAVLKICSPQDICRELPAALDGGHPIGLASDQRSLAALRTDLAVADDTAVVLTTSGSTGNPKGVELSGRALLASAAATRALLGGFTWTCALPTHYVAGLMVLVRGLADKRLGLGEGTRFAAKDLHDLQLAPGRNAISIVPTQLVRALENSEITKRLASFDAVLVGGAALDHKLMVDAKQRGINVIRTYGMSETCGGMVYDGKALPGVQILIDQTSQRISLKTGSAFSGYRGMPELTAEILVGDIVRTQDRGELVDAKLRILGRLDDVVQSGGVNVDLGELGRIVAEISPKAVVFAVPDSRWGSRIALADENGHSLDWWRNTLKTQVSKAAIPKQILKIKAPLTASGKIDRQKLIEIALGENFG